MLNMQNITSFEFGVMVLLIAIWGLGLALYSKVSYLTRLKEMELRDRDILLDDD